LDATEQKRAAAPLGVAGDVVSKRFAESGAVGLLYVSLPGLAAVEAGFGIEAHAQSVRALWDLVERFVAGVRAEGDLLVAAESSPEELVALLFRERSRRLFYTEELPALSDKLHALVRQQAGRIGYPYVTDLADARVGYAVALHNPLLRDDRQLRAALDRARADAQLNARIRARESARAFLSMVLGEKVQSVYQPIVDLDGGRTLAYEALVRGPQATFWREPEALFRAAEEAGVVFEVDCLCRQAALRGFAERRAMSGKLFLNCLPSAIHDPIFRGDKLRETLERCRLTPSDLVFEISEKESIKNFNIFRETRDYYRNLGIQFALDDTGACYAGLEAVMQLAPDYIKVDISLVHSIDADNGRQGLMKAVISMAEAIGAKVIAEGVETEAELETVRALGVSYGQGYLLGRPEPAR